MESEGTALEWLGSLDNELLQDWLGGRAASEVIDSVTRILGTER